MSEKIFGDIKSIEDLNELAKNLKETDEIEEIRLLGQENNVPEKDVEEYINGSRSLLMEPGKVEDHNAKALQSDTWKSVRKALKEDAKIEEKKEQTNPEAKEKKSGGEQFTSASEKLQGQAKNLENLKDVGEYIADHISYIGELQDLILQEHKTMEKCMNYIYEQVKKKVKERSGMQCVAIGRDDCVKLAEDYFKLDDKATEELKAKQEAERKKKQAEVKKKQKEAVKKSTKKTDTKDPGKVIQSATDKSESNKIISEHKKKNEMEGQILLFDF